MPLNEDDKAELVAYLDGELDDVATQAVEAKIATNGEVRAELDALKQTWGMLDYLPKASPSPNFTNRTMERLSLEKVGTSSEPVPAPKHPVPWPMTIGWAAAVLVAVGVGYLATANFWHTPTPHLPAPPEPIPDADVPLVQHLRVLEKWRYYENTDDLDFVKKLRHPDLFGEDPS